MSDSKKDDGLVESPPMATPEEAKEFWTKERLDSCKPVPMPNKVVDSKTESNK